MPLPSGTEDGLNFLLLPPRNPPRGLSYFYGRRTSTLYFFTSENIFNVKEPI